MMNSVLRTIICGMMIVISSSMIHSPVSARSDEKASSRSVRTSHTHEGSLRKVVSYKKYTHKRVYQKSEPKYASHKRHPGADRQYSRREIAQKQDIDDYFGSNRYGKGSLKDNPRYSFHKSKSARCCSSSLKSHTSYKAGRYERHAKRGSRYRVSLKDERRVYKKAASRKHPKNREHAGRAAIVGRSQFSSLIAKHANAMGVPVKLAHAVVSIESSFRASTRGSAGEVGLMQIKPATARAMGFRGTTTALFDPDTNIRYGMKYLAGAYKMSGGSLCGTILRYNAGHYAKRMNPVSARYCSKAKQIIGQTQDL